MKRLFLSFITIILSTNCFSQVEPATPPAEIKDTIYKSTAIDIPAEFPGGMAAWNKYHEKNFNVEIDSTTAMQGHLTIIASFIVHKDGRLSGIAINNPKVGREKIEVAFLNLLKNSPNWKPAIKNGKKISSERLLSITIHFSND